MSRAMQNAPRRGHPETDEFRQLHQALPKNLYDRLMAELHRVALANGISPESFVVDDKKSETVGPRIATWECLLILLERSESEHLKV